MFVPQKFFGPKTMVRLTDKHHGVKSFLMKLVTAWLLKKLPAYYAM
jgi:hypothetical protein